MSATASTRPLRILVVEDDPVARRAMQFMLEYRGHRVAVAASPPEALERAASLEPNVLISDWKLDHVQDGIDVAAQLCSHGDLAVIMVTAHRLDRLQRDAERAGVQIAASLRKPVSIHELAEVAESLG